MNITKTITTGIAIGSLLAVTALPTLAANDKAPLYGPNDVAFTCPTGGAVTPSTFGFVNINPQNGQLQVEVAVKGAEPNTTYDIYVNQDPGGCPTVKIGTMTTNNQGNGNVHLSVPQVPGAVNYWASAVSEITNNVLRSPAVQ